MLEHESKKNKQLRSSCDFCNQSKTRCNKDKPSCRRCVRRGQPCVYSVVRRAGRPRKSSPATDGSPGVNNRSNKPKKQDPPEWMMPTPDCLCQQHSSSFLGLDEGDTNSVLADEAIIARNQEIKALPTLDFGLHIGSTLEPGLLHNDTLSPIDSSSNYLSDVFQDGTEEFMAGHYAFTSDRRTRQGSLNSMVANPIKTPPLPTSSASPRSNMEQERNAQQSTGRSGGTILSFSDIEKAFSDESTFLELDSMVHFIVGNGQSNSETAVYSANRLDNRCVCFCSTAANKLLILVSHPALNPRSCRLPLDIAFFFENFIYEIHESVLRCPVCRTNSLHSRVLLCMSTDWVIEILRNVVQSISSRRETQDPSSVGFDGVEDSSIIRVGRLDLDSQLQELCTRSLIKHRLSRLLLTIDKMSKQDNEWRGAALQQTLGIMIQENRHKIQSILAIIEL